MDRRGTVGTVTGTRQCMHMSRICHQELGLQDSEGQEGAGSSTGLAEVLRPQPAGLGVGRRHIPWSENPSGYSDEERPHSRTPRFRPGHWPAEENEDLEILRRRDCQSRVHFLAQNRQTNTC